MKPVAWYKSLSMSKHRREHGCFLIEGARAVDQVLTCHHDHAQEILYVDDDVLSNCASINNVSINNILTDKKISARKISESNMKTICASKTPQGVAAVVKIPRDVYTSNIPEKIGRRILLLEHVQDPGNVGTLIRTAAAFDFDGVILSGKCADPFAPKVIQSTAGSILSVWLRRTDDYLSMIDELQKDHAYKIIAADLRGEEISLLDDRVNNIINNNVNNNNINVNQSDKIILALGNEAAGLSEKLLAKCDRKIKIPIDQSKAESLNVAVSGGIFMWAMRRRA